MKRQIIKTNISFNEAQTELSLGELLQNQHPLLTPSLINKLYRFVISLILFAAYCTGTLSYASDGKLGIASTATVDISIHINQGFSSIAPTEILLDEHTSSSQPFCVAHRGYSDHAIVPYELEIIEVVPAGVVHSINSPFNFYIENAANASIKQNLVQGQPYSANSNMPAKSISEESCLNSGNRLALELKKEFLEATSVVEKSGLLILMVSPI